MAEIHIPFHDDMQQAIVDGKKTMTSRSKRYGHAGDMLQIRGHRYMLTSVYKKELGFVAKYCYQFEGFDSEAAFWVKWKEIHPRRNWPEIIVWVHEFKAVA
jgi:hypothetical protein